MIKKIPSLIFIFAMFSSTFFAAFKLGTVELSAQEKTGALAPNSRDEPLAKQFSHEKAALFLQSVSLNWTSKRKCFTCHTNYLYLISRGAAEQQTKAHQQIRNELEVLVTQRWEEKGPRWDAEVVMSAAVLAMNDAATTGKLHSATSKALHKMWSVQRADGGFDWLKCNWPPMESDDHFGATMAAIGVGAAPGDYASTPQAQVGIKKLRAYLQKTPAPTLHHQAMVLWAATSLEGIADKNQQQKTIEALLAKQNADGGWSLAGLGNWVRSDGKKLSAKTSDGYGTGFVIYVLRKAGVAAGDAQIQKGIAWLKANQRESGRWFTRSQKKDSKHFITHAGTAFALLALAECESRAKQVGGE